MHFTICRYSLANKCVPTRFTSSLFSLEDNSGDEEKGGGCGKQEISARRSSWGSEVFDIQGRGSKRVHKMKVKIYFDQV